MSEIHREEASVQNAKRIPPRKWIVGLGAIGLGLVLGILFVYPPDQHGFYPRCLFKGLTGLDCPGCGGLRAFHHFLHGRWQEAWRLNAFAMVAGTWVLMIGLIDGYRWKRGASFANPLRQTWVWWVMMVVMVAFGLGRNIRFP